MATQQSYDDAASSTGRIRNRWNRFTAWRVQRPFLGGLLLCVAGVLITWVPMQILPDIIFVGGQMTGFLAVGAMFGVFVFLTGAFALYKPEHSDVIGVVGVTLSILSLFGSLGGLFVGLLFGILGGNLCLAWKPDEEDTDERVTEPSIVDRTVARVRNRLERTVGPAVERLRERLSTVTARGTDE